MSSSSSSSFHFTESKSSVSSRGFDQSTDSHETVGTSEEASESGVQEDHVDVALRLAVELAEDNLPCIVV